ncbi:MAG: hypothetical protein DWQ34_03630 [Planctomycetota bacterium]|nr:MAG: hypothetical protein DWQ34_03630 [Planctomycetota bacterium]REK20065.1 MAG: hypothetical protein DWQ41_26460 [Planctomycetota bacterium]REK28353.1 MAG: hypothetical protein DWQ45_24545 [Planctomycetota bacterium]
MSSPDPEIIRTHLFEIINIQMRSGEPPETKQTYDRLISDGHPQEEVMKMLACVVMSEIFGALKNKQPYDHQRYTAALRALPELPWDDEE